MAERDEKGRFKKGESGNPAGLSLQAKERREQYQDALEKAVTLADFAAIAKKTVELAKRGNLAATKLLFERLLPALTQRAELTGADGEGLTIVIKPQGN